MGTKNETLCADSLVAEFYTGKSVLVTGATGFLGTVLLEKLLFSCPGIKNIYTIIKPKKGVSSKARLHDLLENEAFQRVREQNPTAFDKVKAINGDILEKDLGISEEDRDVLQSEVSIVLHVAASVHFHKPIYDAVNINTRATEKLLLLARKMVNLQAFVYVSTGYSQSRKNNDIIEEKIYQTATSVESALYAIDYCSQKNQILENLIDGRPNTYTYSKALTEHLIESHFSDLPVTIVRPTVITGAFKEPLPGWVQSWGGANGVVALEGRGWLRVWRGGQDSVIDIIPVDFVANTVIVAAWDVHKHRTEFQTVKVFNCTSSSQNPLTVAEFMLGSVTHSKSFYRRDLFFLPPTLVLLRNNRMFSILFFILQTIPVYIVRGLCDVFGIKARWPALHKRILKLDKDLGFFTVNQFIFMNRNVRDLYQAMNKTDRKTFCFDVNQLNWSNYLKDYVKGLKKSMLHTQTLFILEVSSGHSLHQPCL